MKRFINELCVIAVITFCFIALTASAFAETVNGIFVSSNSLQPGEEFTVSINVPPAENADTASVKIKYDENAFEVIEWSPEIPGSVSNCGNGVIALSAANIERVIDLSNGLVLTASMKTRENADAGEYVFELVDNSFCYVKDNGYEFEEVWIPDTTKISVNLSVQKEVVNYEDPDIQNSTHSESVSLYVISGLVIIVILIVVIIISKQRK